MAPVTPAQTEELVRANLAAQPRGGKVKAVAELGARMGRSVATVYRNLQQVTVRAPRKTRSDKGKPKLPRHEAEIISAWLMDGLRKNNKRLRSVAQALQELRYAGKVRAERVCPTTGEVLPLSPAAVAKALKAYKLHPDQMLRPAPAAAMQSLHPNHVWLIDASLCVLYYLPLADKQRGLQVMDADKFYKNKPKAIERIESERVWRYLCVDHYSGSVFCHYVQGAESGANLVESFIRAVTPRTIGGQTDPFYGVPWCVYMDPGAANTGALFNNLARRLQVQVLVHAPGNARATGAVERMHDIWEHVFESALRSEPVASLEELNQAAMVYARFFNATAIHTRHGRTRTDMWLSIAAEHKRVPPSADTLRLLATHRPEARKVEPWPGPVVRFAGKVYDVSKVPGVTIGEKLMVTHSPWLQDHASVVIAGDDGQEELVAVPQVLYNEAGFPVDAAVLGQEWKRPAETELEANRKRIERLAMGADTDEQAQAARRARKPVFDGQVRPLDEARRAVLPTPLPKRGTELQPTAQTQAPVRSLSLFESAAALAAPEYVGKPLTPEQIALLRSLHPEGMPEDQLPALAARLKTRAALRVVNGGQ